MHKPSWLKNQSGCWFAEDHEAFQNFCVATSKMMPSDRTMAGVSQCIDLFDKHDFLTFVPRKYYSLTGYASDPDRPRCIPHYAVGGA